MKAAQFETIDNIFKGCMDNIASIDQKIEDVTESLEKVHRKRVAAQEKFEQLQSLSVLQVITTFRIKIQLLDSRQ